VAAGIGAEGSRGAGSPGGGGGCETGSQVLVRSPLESPSEYGWVATGGGVREGAATQRAVCTDTTETTASGISSA